MTQTHAKNPTQTRRDLLQIMADNAEFDGFGREALPAAADAQGVSADFALSLFDGGSHASIAHHYWQWQIDALRHNLQHADINLPGTTAKVAHGVQCFLGIADDSPVSGGHKQARSAATAALMPPSRLPLLAKHLWSASDAVWRFAGDRSTDSNYYSKRLLLAKVITACQIYQFQTRAEDNEAARAFLDRQLHAVLKAGQWLARGQKPVRSLGGAIADLLKVLSPYAESPHRRKPRPNFQNASLRIKEDNIRSSNFISPPLSAARHVARRIVIRGLRQSPFGFAGSLGR